MTGRQENAPKSLLETTLNTRDLGGYRSAISGKPLRSWSILRSDVPGEPSQNDIRLLRQHNILTIIDMRGPKDTESRPSGFADREGFTCIHVPIEEGSGIPESTDAVGRSYLDIAQSKNIVRVFRSIAAAQSGVMINCTAGKDRTGVVSAVLLGLCGVSGEDVVRDYMLTKTYSRERFAYIHSLYPSVDMNIVIPDERYMREFLALLAAEYGSFRDYLTAIGVTDGEIERIAAALL